MVSEQNIEVEIRSFITEEKYKDLLEFFTLNSEFVKEDFQETHYFDCEQDLRIQKNKQGSKIWLKKGNLHDDSREEIEIHTQDNELDNLQKLFNTLGHKVEIKWIRERKQFLWEGIKVCLDYTKGYGYIIELEKMASDSDKEQVLQKLKQKFSELQIPITPKEIFAEKYNHYKENWRNLV